MDTGSIHTYLGLLLSVGILCQINRNVVLGKKTGKQPKYALPTRHYSLPSVPYSSTFARGSQGAYSPPYNKGHPVRHPHDRYPQYRQYSGHYPGYGSNIRQTTYFPPAQVAQPPRGYPQASQLYRNQPPSPQPYPNQPLAAASYRNQPPSPQPYPNQPLAAASYRNQPPSPQPYPTRPPVSHSYPNQHQSRLPYPQRPRSGYPQRPRSGYPYQKAPEYHHRYPPVRQSRFPNPAYPAMRNNDPMSVRTEGIATLPIPSATQTLAFTKQTTQSGNSTASPMNLASEHLVKTLKSMILDAKGKKGQGPKLVDGKMHKYPLGSLSATTVYSMAGRPQHYRTRAQGTVTPRGHLRKGYPMTQSVIASRRPTIYPTYHIQSYPNYHSTTHSMKHATKKLPNKTFHHQTTAAATSTTTTSPPTTTTTVIPTPFPQDFRCSVQSECEVGCCYTAEGAILWDHISTSGKHGYCHTKISPKPGDGCHPMMCPCQAQQACVSVPSENAQVPSELPEGGYLGNPKCYTKHQEAKIKSWLNKLEAIVALCRMDISCPLRINVQH